MLRPVSQNTGRALIARKHRFYIGANSASSSSFSLTSVDSQRGALQALAATLLQVPQRLWLNKDKVKPEFSSQKSEVQIPWIDHFLQRGSHLFDDANIIQSQYEPHEREKDLMDLIEQRKRQQAMQTYRSLKIEKLSLSPLVLSKLTRLMVSKKRPLDAVKVFEDYKRTAKQWKQNDTEEYHYLLFERVLDSFSYIEVQKLRDLKEVKAMVRKASRFVLSLPPERKLSACSILLASLLDQRSASLAEPYVKDLFCHLWRSRGDVPIKYWAHLLPRVRYRRKKEVPFAQILHYVVVENGNMQVHPSVVLQLVDHLYPYEDPRDVHWLVNSLLALQKSKGRDYVVETSVIDYLAHACGRVGSHENVLLVWDLFDSQSQLTLDSHAPVSLYEATAITLASSNVPDLWPLLQEFQQTHGPISRALIKSIASRFNSRPDLLNKAQESWFWGSGLRVPSTNSFDAVPCLNILLCAQARRGALNRIHAIWDEFALNQWTPDLNSYSFALKGLARVARDKEEASNELEEASLYLSQMEGHSLVPDSSVIQAYVELLCVTGRVKVAVEIVNELPANSKTVYRVISTLLDRNRELSHEAFLTASELSELLPERLPMVENKLVSYQRRLSSQNDNEPKCKSCEAK